MSTIAQAITRQPQAFQDRYPDAYWVRWINSLLEELSSMSILPPCIVESGAVVQDSVWAERPPRLRAIEYIRHPMHSALRYNWSEVNNRIRLEDVTIPDSGDVLEADALTDAETDSIVCNVDDLEEDQLSYWLMVVTAGTRQGDTFVLRGNAPSSSGTTKVYFQHTLPAAFGAGDVTEVKFLPVSQYVLLRYTVAFAPLTTVADTIPIPEPYALRVVDTWLTYACERESQSAAQETQVAEMSYRRAVIALRSELRGGPRGPFRGRRMPSLKGAM